MTKLTTKYGDVAVTPTSADHVHVTTNPGSGRDADRLDLVINGKLYRGNLSAHMHRWSDGKFHVGEQKDNLAAYHSLYFDAGTDAAKKTMRAALELVVNAWAESAEGQQALHDAAVADLRTKIERANAKRQDALFTVNALDNELAALNAALRKL
jgi:hypothetical protein